MNINYKNKYYKYKFKYNLLKNKHKNNNLNYDQFGGNQITFLGKNTLKIIFNNIYTQFLSINRENNTNNIYDKLYILNKFIVICDTVVNNLYDTNKQHLYYNMNYDVDVNINTDSIDDSYIFKDKYKNLSSINNFSNIIFNKQNYKHETINSDPIRDIDISQALIDIT